jgi:RNA polymerase sigma-70 factor (ECF subfamily)
MRVMPHEPWRRPQGPARVEDLLEHADALYNLARHLTRVPADAEDLVQETYQRAIAAWDRFVPGTNAKAWLFRILRNAFVTRWRRAERQPAAEVYDTTEKAGAGAVDPDVLQGDAELGRLRRVVSRDIEAALSRLGEDARTAILLDLEGFTEGEVAQILGCAVGTVKSRLSRARAALRAELADYGAEDRP